MTAAAGNVIHGDNINHRPPPAHSLDIAGFHNGHSTSVFRAGAAALLLLLNH